MKICWCFCGSFCTFSRAFAEMESFAREGNEIIPVGSFNFLSCDTRFGSARSHRAKIEEVCQREMIDSIVTAEPVGPVIKPDITIVAPCTGNTLSKIASGVSDTPVTLAVKAHLRTGKPVLIALASNDALGANMQNIASLLVRRNVFFVPMREDDPINKRDSLVCDFSLIGDALSSALRGDPLRPLFLGT